MRYYGTTEDLKSWNNCHGKWESVIAYGNARYVEDEQELQHLLNNKFLPYYGKEKREIQRTTLAETRVIVMEVTRMTARRELETNKQNSMNGKSSAVPALPVYPAVSFTSSNASPPHS